MASPGAATLCSNGCLIPVEPQETTLNDDRALGNDKDLVKQVLEGKPEAFDALIGRYERLVTHIVYRTISDDEDRRDLCQDVFVKVYSNLAGFQFEAKLSTWIGRIAYNACINHLRKRREDLIDEVLPNIESVDRLPAQTTLPDEETEARDLARRLRREIAGLPATHRTILALYHIDEMSYAEIAEITGMPEGTVKSHLFRARKHLRRSLLSKYSQEDL
jgi:RNA polymerase sigma factor (sigma-70 family)